MTDVFDRETGKKADVSPEDAAVGIVSGKLALNSAAGPIRLAGKDGTIFKAAPDKVAGALSTGAYRLLSPDEELQHQVEAEERAKGATGSVVAGAKEAGNQLLFGVPEAIAEHTDTPEEMKETAFRNAYHASARLAGGIVGAGASLFTGGELFKGAELAGQVVEHGIVPAADAAHAALATRLAGSAANMATQGAALASPQALVHLIAGDPKKAAETLLWGIGPGAILGAGGELASSGVRAGAEAIGGALGEGGLAGRLAKFSEDTGVKAIGGQRAQINKLAPEGEFSAGGLVDFAHEQGFIRPGMSRAEVGDAVGAAHEKYGAQIGKAIDDLDSVLGVEGATAPLEKRTGKEIADYLREHPEKNAAEVYADLGKHPDVMFKEPVRSPVKNQDAIDAALKPGDISSGIRDALDSPEMNMPMNADQKRALQMVLDSADMLPTKNIGGTEVVPFETANKFLSDLRNKWIGGIKKSQSEGGIKGLETVTALDKVKADAYGAARNAVHAAADEVAAASENPELVGALQAAKKNYAKTSELEKWVANREAQEAGNRTVGLTDFINMGHGPVGMGLGAVGTGLGALVGGPAGAMAGGAIGRAMGVPLDFLAKKWMEDKGLVAISAVARRAAKGGPDVFSAVLASEGQKRLAATMDITKDAVKRMAQVGIEATGANHMAHMGHLLGDTSGLSHDQQFAKLHSRLASLTANPVALASAANNIAAPFGSTSPEIREALSQKMQDAIHYLNDSMPKPSGPPLPFSPNDWTPTAKQKMAFHDRAEVVANPMRAVEHMVKGTLSTDHIHALGTVYPEVYTAMKSAILDFSARHPDVKLPVAERRSVAMFLGQPLDASMQHLPALQATYNGVMPAGGGGGAAPKSKGGGSKSTKAKIKNWPTAASAFSATQGPAPSV